MATGTNGNDALYTDRPSTNPWFPGRYDRYLSGLIGNKLRLHGSCQGDLSRSFKEKLVSVTLSLRERCDN
jgi:hypothetical protein